MKHYLLSLALVAGTVAPCLADVTDDRLRPAYPGLPIAHPVATKDIAPPPFSTPQERGVAPAYVAGLPGLPQGRVLGDDFGRKTLKYDGVFIRQSRVENGEVVIPPGGLAYLEDTWGGEVALRGEALPVLGRIPTYIDYDMSIVIKENVTIPAGQSVTVGGTVYNNYASVGHETLVNHTLHTRTIAGTDWEWAFGAPVLSETETGWYGMSFNELYNQGQAREVNRKQMVFDWLSGVRMDRLLLAEDTVFNGLAEVGDHWDIGGRDLSVTAVDPTAGTVTVELRESGHVIATKALGPIVPERLIEDTTARKALIFEHEDVVAFLSPWPTGFEEGKARLKVYGGAFSLNYGDPYAGDARYTVYPVGCPTGHNFGYMLVNAEEIRIPAGGFATGPEEYFRIVVSKIENGAVTSWHIEDAEGNRSLDLGGATVTNVDLVLGQGRVAGQAILKDVGRDLLARTYNSAVQYANASLSEGAQPASQAQSARSAQILPLPDHMTPSVWIAVAIAVISAGAIGMEAGRRKG